MHIISSLSLAILSLVAVRSNLHRFKRNLNSRDIRNIVVESIILLYDSELTNRRIVESMNSNKLNSNCRNERISNWSNNRISICHRTIANTTLRPNDIEVCRE